MAIRGTVNHLGVEYGGEFFEQSMELSEEGQVISEAMAEYGLKPQAERSHLFSIYSPDSRKAIAVSITPFSGENRDIEGGLSISEGGHAQGVVVQMEDGRVVSFAHYAMENGALRVDRFEADALMKIGTRDLAQEAGKVKSARPLVEMNVRQVTSLSTLSYGNLLTDEFALSAYSEDEIQELRGNARVVSEISRFILLRTSGSSCCSCSTSCWGSCSSSCSYVG